MQRSNSVLSGVEEGYAVWLKRDRIDCEEDASNSPEGFEPTAITAQARTVVGFNRKSAKAYAGIAEPSKSGIDALAAASMQEHKRPYTSIHGNANLGEDVKIRRQKTGNWRIQVFYQKQEDRLKMRSASRQLPKDLIALAYQSRKVARKSARAKGFLRRRNVYSPGRHITPTHPEGRPVDGDERRYTLPCTAGGRRMRER